MNFLVSFDELLSSERSDDDYCFVRSAWIPLSESTDTKDFAIQAEGRFWLYPGDGSADNIAFFGERLVAVCRL